MIAVLNLPLVLFVAAIVAMIVLRVQRFGFQKVRVPSCAGCGYAVEGLTVLRCPECGEDLRNVGIITPHMRPPVPVWLWILLWTMLVPFPALLSSSLIVRSWASQRQISAVTNFTSPHSGDFNGVRITCTTSPANQEYQIVVCTLQLNDGSQSGSLHVIERNQSYEISSPHSRVRRSTNAFDEVAVSEWMAENGLDATNNTAEAKDIFDQIDRYLNGQMSATGSSFGGVTTNSTNQLIMTRNWMPVVLALFWIMVWTLGVLLIVRRRRKRVKGNRDAEPAHV